MSGESIPSGSDPLPYASLRLPDSPVRFKKSIWTMIADRNPFFLISAVCMLWGCLSLTNSSSWNSLPLPRLLLLIGTLNFYEFTLIGLAVLLIRRGLLRDGNILLILEAFFLVDVAFLNAEVVTARPGIGMAVNALLLVLAMAKLRLIRIALGAVLSPARIVFIAVQMFVLLGLPCYFRHLDHGALPPVLFYAAWWVVGLMPAVGLVIRRLMRTSTATPPLAGLAGLLVCLPWVSLIAHLGILHYAYGVEYLPAMAAPVLLGITLCLTRLVPGAMMPRGDMAVMQLLLPIVAVFVSATRPETLTIFLFGRPTWPLNTLVLTAGAAYLTVVYCYFWWLALRLIAIGAALAALAVFGPTVVQIRYAVWRAWEWLVQAMNWLMPNSPAQWGIVSVVASFFFLVLGAMISLRRAPARAA